MTDRRTFTTVVSGALLTAPWRSGAQPAGRIARVGYLGFTATNTADDERVLQAFRQGLREQGFVEGGNLVIESRFSEGKMERYADLAAERPEAAMGGIHGRAQVAQRGGRSRHGDDDVLRTEPGRHVQACGDLRRQDPERREAT